MGTQNIGNIPVVTNPIMGNEISSSAGLLMPPGSIPFLCSKESNFGLAASGTPVSRTEWKYQANGNGTVLGFHAGVLTPGSAASVTVDLQKNGSSVLSAPITLTNASTAGAKVNATISVPSYVAGDNFTFVLTVSTSTGMQGVFAYANFFENGVLN